MPGAARLAVVASAPVGRFDAHRPETCREIGHHEPQSRREGHDTRRRSRSNNQVLRWVIQHLGRDSPSRFPSRQRLAAGQADILGRRLLAAFSFGGCTPVQLRVRTLRQ